MQAGTSFHSETFDFKQYLINLDVMIIQQTPRTNVCKVWNLAEGCWRSSRNGQKAVCTKKHQLFCLHDLQCTGTKVSLNSLGTATVQIKIIGIKDLQVARLKHLFLCQLYFSIPAWQIGWEDKVLLCLERTWLPTDAEKVFLTVFTLSWL